MNGPHKPNDIVQNRYIIVGKIGEGGMQYVYKTKDTILEREVALKTPQNHSASKRFEKSAIISARINHPNVAKTIDCFVAMDRQYLIEEYIPGENLDSALLRQVKQLDPYLAARVVHHIVKGLAASHHAGVFHRDIKPANIMVEGGYQLKAVKITDFGIAKMAEEVIEESVKTNTISSSSTVFGALPYMAPEAITNPKSVNTAADIWSVGALAYTLLVGTQPYGIGLNAVAKIVEARTPEFPKSLTSSPQFAPLVNNLIKIILLCLKKDPLERPTADTLVTECGQLCYPIEKRYFGTVKKFLYQGQTCGFIYNTGNDVFFHQDSVCGSTTQVKLGDTVMYSKYSGGGADRAHPVVKMEVS